MKNKKTANLAFALGLAEILGIAEEVVDKR